MVPAASGSPQYSGNFIPEVWSGLLNEKFYLTTIFPGIANTRYEGEIKNQGDKVYIRNTPDIEIHTGYTKGQKLEIDHPDKPVTTWEITRGAYFSFICDSVDKHQSDINLLEDWSMDAGQQMKIEIDSEGLGDVYSYADSDNSGASAGADSGGYDLGASGSPVAITTDNVLDMLMDMSGCLDEQSIPEANRWFALPSWYVNLLKRSDLKDVSMTGDSKSPLRNGKVGEIDQIAVHKSNQIKSTTDSGYKCYYPMAGHQSAITFASQMNEMRTVQDKDVFGEIVQGLNVYDWKVVLPKSLVTAYVRKG
ncbi:MAG: hypothetical protein SVM79_00015 [Chloroflexota bacterium]|nr:hypothetical protein [Chloroflexota bacterium]